MIFGGPFCEVGRDRRARRDRPATFVSESDGLLPKVGITRATFGIILLATLFTLSVANERDDWLNRMQPITPLSYVVRHAKMPIAVDGKADDPAWADASWTTDFVDIEGAVKPKPRFRTRAKMLWDENYFYILAELEEPHIWATLTKHDSVIFNDPDFEVFIDPDDDTHAYSEFEINALNTSWDLHLPKPYMDGGSAQNEWEIPGLKTSVRVDGTLNNPTDTDRGWTVEIAFPWSAFSAHARHDGAPVEGEQWRLNFSRVEWRVTTDDGAYRKVPATPEDNWVWSPQGVIDMHRPEMWASVQFTRRPASEPVAIAPLAGRAARAAALEIYYAQRDYFAAHQQWARTLTELGGDAIAHRSAPDVGTPELRSTADGYECSVIFKEGGAQQVWRIRQDRRLTLEPASADGVEEKK